MPTQKQITLVRNLIALMRSPFPAEAEEAKRKAQELILKYKITEADMLPPTVQPQRRPCPGCPNCMPQPGIRVRMYAWWNTSDASGSTTTSGSANWFSFL